MAMKTLTTFGEGLKYLRVIGLEERFEPHQVTFHRPKPNHPGGDPMGVLIHTGYYELDNGPHGVHMVPVNLVYFTREPAA